MTDRDNTLGAHIPLIYHHAMLLDAQRMEGFREAIQLVVPEGGTVLELGGGSGVLSFFAAQKAAKVYCVEKIPGNAAAAKKFLANNPHGDRVEVICADAFDYLPPEPVDVVICEMLHVGMIRERQIEVIEAFKSRYTQRFGEKLPRFIPEAFIQGVQPINYTFDFFGYKAQLPVFQPAGQVTEACLELSDPSLFQIAQYCDPLSVNIVAHQTLTIAKAGYLNAVRFILKNLLAILPRENRSIDWHNNYLILPLSQPIEVNVGDRISISLNYQTGCEIEELAQAILVTKSAPSLPLAAQIIKTIVDSQGNEIYSESVSRPARQSDDGNAEG